MSELHVRQIRANLEKVYRRLIDLSDVGDKKEEDATNHFLSRALAALALSYIANTSPEDAAKAITDGFHDNGLDAIYYQPSERMLFVVQSKWRDDGAGSMDRGEMQKFLTGVKDLLNARWERFNPRIAARASELDAALDDASTRIVLLIAYTGQAPLSQEVSRDLQDQIDDLNDPTELVSRQVLRQGDIYSAVSEALKGAPVDIDLALYEWGQVREPYVGFYGQVAAADVASWFMKHQYRLLAPNIRMFLGSTEVNDSILATLMSAPQEFWYFNNGITALCRSINKKPIGGSTRETGFFECRDLRVVNGAQTVGAIAQAATRDHDGVSKARVAIRLISLENCPPEFGKLVTRFNNTQNRIDRRDFVALDPQQERLRGELQMEGITYVYKSGEVLPTTAAGFDLVEATVARACLQADVALAVQAKREIGKLWEDIEKQPYKILFNASISGPTLWRNVQIVRQVEQVLANIRKIGDGRRRLMAVHGNRSVTHLVFLSLPEAFKTAHHALNSDEQSRVQELASCVFDNAMRVMNALFQDAYLAMLFKNAKKCAQLIEVFKAEGASLTD